MPLYQPKRIIRYPGTRGIQGEIGPAGAGGASESLVGTQDGINQTFTISNTPKFITWNGQVLYENNGYTLSGLTLTLDIAPQSGDILKSHY